VEPSVPAGIPILDISGLENFMPPRPMNLRQEPGARSQESGARSQESGVRSQESEITIYSGS